MLVISCWLVWHMQWANNLSLHRVRDNIEVNIYFISNVCCIQPFFPVKTQIVNINFFVSVVLPCKIECKMCILQLSLRLTSLPCTEMLELLLFKFMKCILEIKWLKFDWHVFLTNQEFKLENKMLTFMRIQTIFDQGLSNSIF